jgi:hypothetical protein
MQLRAELAALKRESAKPPEERELEQKIVASELEIRRILKRLRGFGAPNSAFTRELMGPTGELNRAVDALAALRGER